MTIEWGNKDISYLLGVIHGDGHVSYRNIQISVGYKDKDYALYLSSLISKQGYNPKIYRNRGVLSVQIHNKVLTDEIRKYKSDGVWSIPRGINLAEWVAGIYDTDGCVTSPPKRAIIIGLKRSGNLEFVKQALIEMGISNLKIHNRISKFNGRDYPIEEMRITSFDNIKKFNDNITLRYPRKKERLQNHINYINKESLKVPLWEEIAKWLKEEAHTWQEIADRYHLTKKQVDSVMQNIKVHYRVELIPPPRNLTKYYVNDQS